MISLTDPAQKWLSDVFDVIIFVKHINMMFQFLFVVAPAGTTCKHMNRIISEILNPVNIFLSGVSGTETTHSSSNWAISASSCSLLLSSSSISSAGLTLASSDTWSWEGPRKWQNTYDKIKCVTGGEELTYRWFEVWMNFLKSWEWSSVERVKRNFNNINFKNISNGYILHFWETLSLVKSEHKYYF